MNKKMAVPRSQAVGPNSTRTNTRHEQETDVLLIGGGIMSATLGTWLQELEPDWSITMVEQMSSVAEESSNGWNNAGTGHAALMELNYTPQTANGINIDKAVDINEAFHISRQFWAHQVTRGVLNKPKSFINSVPHMSFVWGEDNVNFLRARYAALQQSELFRGIRYSEDHQQIKAWAPLVMEGRDPLQKVAATRTEMGTDVNYGEITRQLIASLQKHDNFSLQLGTVVRRFKRNADKSWTVTLADADNRRQKRVIKAKFIFIGAGGAALRGTRRADRLPVWLGYGLLIVSVGLLVGQPLLARYAIAALLFKFTWTFVLPFILARVAGLDNSGRLMNSINLVIGGGMAAGPGLAGVLLQHFASADPLLAAAGVCALLSLILIVAASAAGKG